MMVCGENLETHGNVKIWEPMGLLMAGKIHPDVWRSVSRLWLPDLVDFPQGLVCASVLVPPAHSKTVYIP